MRKKALVVLAIVLLALLVWLYLSRNRLLDSAIEAAGSALVGAKVEVDGVDVDLVHLRAGFARLQITNPRDTWHNLLEFGPSQFDVRAEPLVWNRFVVDDFSVTRIRINSPRSSDGALPGGKEAPGPSLFERAKRGFLARLEQTPAADLGRLATRKVNVDSILKVLEIGTVDSVRQLKDSLQQQVQFWRKRVPELDPRRKLREIQALVEPIRPADIRTVQELTDALERVKKAQGELQSLRTEVEPVLAEASGALKTVRARFARVDDWARQDLQRARSKLGLPSLEPAAISEMLFGRAIVEKALGAIYWVGVAREAMPVATKARALAQAGSVKKPPRGKGVNVIFPVKHRWPKWLIRHIEISATSSRTDTTRRWDFAGEVTGLTSHPAVYGKPATLSLEGQVPGGSRFELSGVLDHRHEVPVDQFELRTTRLRLGRVPLVQAKYLPEAVVLGASDVTFNLDLEGEKMELHLALVSPDARFVMPESSDRAGAASLLRQVFEDLPTLQLEAWIQGHVDRPRFRFRSNLDRVLSNKLKQVAGQQIERARGRVEARVRQEVEKQKADLERWYAENVEPLVQQVNSYKAELEKERQALEEKRKELEQRIEEEKKKARRQLEGKAKKAVKSLLQGRRP